MRSDSVWVMLDGKRQSRLADCGFGSGMCRRAVGELADKINDLVVGIKLDQPVVVGAFGDIKEQGAGFGADGSHVCMVRQCACGHPQ